MTDGPGGYDPANFPTLAAIEEQHFWFRARINVIRRLAGRAVAGLKPGYRVLEVGCGTGNVLRVLSEVCQGGLVVGLDRFSEGLRFARLRNPDVNLVQADALYAPFATRFHMAGLFDVLEHLPQDREALAGLYQLLEPSGKLLLTVPAHPGLWSDFDTWSGHCRRYSLPELREKLGEAGFVVDFISEYMAATFPILWMIRRLRSKRDTDLQGAAANASRELRVIPGVNQLLLGLLNLEGRWIGRRKRLPKGASIVALATRPPGAAR